MFQAKFSKKWNVNWTFFQFNSQNVALFQFNLIQFKRKLNSILPHVCSYHYHYFAKIYWYVPVYHLSLISKWYYVLTLTLCLIKTSEFYPLRYFNKAYWIHQNFKYNRGAKVRGAKTQGGKYPGGKGPGGQKPRGQRPGGKGPGGKSPGGKGPDTQ